MIIFLYGTDSYRIKQTKEDHINRHQKKYQSGINLLSFDFSATNDAHDLEDALRTVSFFNEHKLLVCRNLFDNKETAEKVFLFLKNQKPTENQDVTVLVVESLSEKDLNTKHKELFKLLSNKANAIKVINPLEGAELTEWIRSEFQTRNCQIEKLANYSNEGEVKADYISLLTHQKTELNIFNLIDAVAQKNKAKAFGLLYQELKSSRDPYYILTMIIYQFRNLLNIKGLQEQGCSQSDIARKTKLHPFVVRKALASLDKFNQEELKVRYKHLLFADTSFKNGQNNLEDTLFSLISHY